MPEPAPDRAWKIASAAIVIGIALGILWYVEWRSQPPPPPSVTFPYPPPERTAPPPR